MPPTTSQEEKMSKSFFEDAQTIKFFQPHVDEYNKQIETLVERLNHTKTHDLRKHAQWFLDNPSSVEFIVGCLYKQKGGRRRNQIPAKKFPKNQDWNLSRVVWERAQWHNIIPGGSASLWGPMMSIGRIPKEDMDRIDTLFCGIAAMHGLYTATHRWKEALGM